MAKTKKGTSLTTLDRTRRRADEFHAREKRVRVWGPGRRPDLSVDQDSRRYPVTYG